MNRMLIGLLLLLGSPFAAQGPELAEPYFLFAATYHSISELTADYVGSTVGIRFKNDSLASQVGMPEEKLPIQHQRNWNKRDRELDGIRVVGKSGRVKWHFLFEVIGSEDDSVILAPYFRNAVHLKLNRNEILGFTSTGTKKNRWITFSIWMGMVLLTGFSLRLLR